MEMTGWLAQRRARIIGDCSAVTAALIKNGATLCAAGSCDILVHTVSAPTSVAAHEIGLSAWRDALDQGLDQRFFEAKAFADHCREVGRGGVIVFVGAPEQMHGSAHAAAAGALGNLTKTLGVEWARDGIRVNAVLTTNHDETLGNLVAYLASDYAAYVTGAVMGISHHD